MKTIAESYIVCFLNAMLTCTCATISRICGAQYTPPRHKHMPLMDFLMLMVKSLPHYGSDLFIYCRFWLGGHIKMTLDASSWDIARYLMKSYRILRQTLCCQQLTLHFLHSRILSPICGANVTFVILSYFSARARSVDMKYARLCVHLLGNCNGVRTVKYL